MESKYKIDSAVINIYNKAVIDEDEELQRNCIEQIEESVSYIIEDNKLSVASFFTLVFAIVTIICVIFKIGGEW
tara:strand:+ start:385 stop:606 length:222 start_codon:yes stop_codon:yes gene_type:complete